MNNKKPDTQKGLEETAREMADAIYEIMGTGDVLVSESRQKEVTKVLSNYYNLECTAP
nr:hypothetical protein [uncultured Draconibacterium sp.]